MLRRDPNSFPRRGELARRGSDRPLRIIEGNISSELGECFHLTDAVLRVPHVHPNVKALNWHRHGSTCTSRTNFAMLPVKDRRIDPRMHHKPLLARRSKPYVAKEATM